MDKPFVTNGPAVRVFVVENHADTLHYFERFLTKLGFLAFSADCVGSALASIPLAGCDILISDIGLPDGTGWDLLQRLQKAGLPHPSYAIAMSGYGRNADPIKSLEAGFRHHLLKPFDPAVLGAFLKEARAELTSES